MQGLATVMFKAGEGSEMIEMLRRAVQVARDAGKTKEATNIRILLGQMYIVRVSFTHFENTLQMKILNEHRMSPQMLRLYWYVDSSYGKGF